MNALPLNLLFVGAPGMGKSEFVKSLLLRLARLYGFYFIVEEGLSHAPVTRSFGLEPIIWRLEGQQSLNPGDTQGLPWCAAHTANFAGLVARATGLPAAEDEARLRVAFLSKTIQQLSREFADDRLRQMTEPERREFIRHAMAVYRWAEQRKLSLVDAFIEWRRGQPAQSDLPGLVEQPATEADLWEFESLHPDVLRDLIFTRLAPDQHLRLSALKEHLELAATGPEGDLCRHLALLMEPFCGEGSYARMFDRPTNISLTGRVVHFELGQIPESASDLKPLIAFLILNQIRTHLLNLPRDVRKILVLEELSRFLAIPGAEKLVRELYEQMRKTNTLVISILQQFSRITDPTLRAAIIGNSPTCCIFSPGDRTDLALLAQAIGLSSVAQETILRYARPAQRVGQTYSEFMLWSADPTRPVCGTVRHFQFAPPAEAGPSVNQNQASSS